MAEREENRVRQHDREAEELAVGPLLARANLLRMRNQWDEAIAACTEAIRKAPRSAAAHSLLGQVYEAQGKTNEAVTWYGLALELDPSSAADRDRWERLTEAQRIRLRTLSPIPGKSARERTIEKTLGIIDRFFPPGQANTVTRMLYALCVAISVLMGISAAVVYVVVGRPRPLPSTTQPTLNAPPVVVPPPLTAQVIEPTPDGRTTVASPTPSPLPSSATTASPAPTLPPGVAVDGNLRDALNRAVNGSFIIMTAYRAPLVPGTPSSPAPDSATGAAQVTLDITIAVTTEWEETREKVVRAAIQAAQLTMNADPKVEYVQTRLALTGLGGRPAPVFNGDLTRAGVTNIDPEQSPIAEVLSRFAAIQWLALPVETGDRPPAIPDAVRATP